MILTETKRPLIKFDPANQFHRELVAKYVKLGNWASCPVEFFTVEQSTITIVVIMQQLAEYYLTNEFSKLTD